MTSYCRYNLIGMTAALAPVLLSLASIPALAQTRLHPALFALPATDFPSGLQVVRSGIESNRRLLRDQQLHFGLPPGILGRRTGYYMDAVGGELDDPGHPYAAYLVSIFRSAKQAQTAFDVRWDTWFAMNYFTTPSSAPITVGDSGAEALFHSLDPSLPPESELFFRRGAILVEVFQRTDGTAPTADQLHSFFAIAARLDALAAVHPLGT